MMYIQFEIFALFIIFQLAWQSAANCDPEKWSTLQRLPYYTSSSDSNWGKISLVLCPRRKVVIKNRYLHIKSEDINTLMREIRFAYMLMKQLS